MRGLRRPAGMRGVLRPAGVAVAALLVLAALLSARVFGYSYRFEAGVLTVSTRRMVLAIEAGAVTYLQDKASGEVLVGGDACAGRAPGERSLAGFLSGDEGPATYARWPTRTAPASLSRRGINGLRLVYRSLGGEGWAGSCELILDLAVDLATGEVTLQATGVEAGTALKPVAVDLALATMATPAVILGSGARYTRLDPEATDQTTYPDCGLYSPSMAVVEGRRAVLAVWSESTRYAPELIRLEHRPESDRLVLHSAQDPKEAGPQRIVSPPWRIGTYPTWERAARRWRQRFEERTGARPLWENRALWVRRVHAVFDATNHDLEAEQAGYAELARVAPPEKVAYLLWNGDRIVLYGDHTLVAKEPRPSPAQLAAIEHYGWPLILYHPYALIYTEVGAARRLQELAGRGWLPEAYRFTPDYAGTAAGWHDYWSPVSAVYPGDSTFYILHPGSNRFKRYLVANLRDYCDLYGADAAYLDVLGHDGNYLFGSGCRVVEGQDYVLGEVEALRALAQALPQVGVMCEYQSPWVLPYAFFSWEGPETHLRAEGCAPARIDHPLRVALTGSYSWTRETDAGQADDVAALLGSLPSISLAGNAEASSERALWSQARARLFCDEELFNDLPEEWEDGALAYYRSKSGHWFQFRRVGASYGYVELLPGGGHVVRLLR